MQIGVIGAATLGWTLATKFAARGHEVLIANRRGPESLAGLIARRGVSLRPATVSAAAGCALVLLAVPWTGVKAALPPAPSWDGRILVDATNIFRSYAPDFEVDDLAGDSGSEIVARLAPGARVAKAFNTLPVATLFAPLPANGLKRVQCVAGDDADAVATVAELAADIGLIPLAVGTLAQGGRQMELGGPFSGLELLARGQEIL